MVAVAVTLPQRKQGETEERTQVIPLAEAFLDTTLL